MLSVSSAIGTYYCYLYLTQMLTDINQAGLNAIKKGLSRRFGIRIDTYVCDITSKVDTASLFEHIKANNIKLNMLLNVAGIDYEGGFMVRPFDQISKIINLNIEATLRVTHGAVNKKDNSSDFYIIFVSSLVAMNPVPLKATYVATKRFLLDFSYALGEELKSQNANVLSLCPGGLPTTDEAMQGIAAQGFWGNVTTNRMERVVRNTINKALHKKKIYVPGATNKLLAFFGKLVPVGLIVKLLFSKWNTTQKQGLH